MPDHDELNTYVPSHSIIVTIPLPSGESIEHTDTIQHELLFGGDQLTASRARGAQALRSSHDTRKDRLVRLLPTPEDWHARVTLLKVCIVFESPYHSTILCFCVISSGNLA